LDNEIMKKSISKKGGKSPVTAVRLAPAVLADVVVRAARQNDRPRRSEAIRRLVELGLTVRTTPKQPPAARADRAKELASKVIDRLTGETPDGDVKSRRKRRLIRGPEEFRDDRVDQPKAKVHLITDRR
jgi:hypothetical protein